MTFKSKLSYEEFTEKFGPQSEKSLYYRISIGKNGIGIKRRGDRTFNERGKVLDKSPLKLQFTDIFSIFFGCVFLALMLFCAIAEELDIQTVLSLSAAVYTALYLASRVRRYETARMLIHDFELELVLDKSRYTIAYNYFYYYAVIAFFAIYPLYVLIKAVFGLPDLASILIAAGGALLVILYFAVTRNITELFFVDREGIMRQNIFFKKDKLVYSAENIESIKVVNKDLLGRDKDSSFSFELTIKDSALYRPESAFPRLKEKKVLYLPFNSYNGEIIRKKLGIDFVEDEYKEFYK